MHVRLNLCTGWLVRVISHMKMCGLYCYTEVDLFLHERMVSSVELAQASGLVAQTKALA